MSDLNQVTITGRLGADPEIRRTQAGKPVASLRLAVSEQWRDQSGEKKERTEWINVTIFSEGLAKVAEQYLKKGAQVLVQGKFSTRKWQDQSGNDRYSTEVVLQGYDAKLVMLGGTGNSDGRSDSRSTTGSRRQDDDAGYGERTGGGGGSYGDLDDNIPFEQSWR